MVTTSAFPLQEKESQLWPLNREEESDFEFGYNKVFLAALLATDSRRGKEDEQLGFCSDPGEDDGGLDRKVLVEVVRKWMGSGCSLKMINKISFVVVSVLLIWCLKRLNDRGA